MTEVQKYIKDNKDRFLEELLGLLKIPSVSADPKYKKMFKLRQNLLKKSYISRLQPRKNISDQRTPHCLW